MTAEARLRRGGEALGLELSPDQIGQLLRLQQELLHWNRRVNLTAVRDPLVSLEKHLLDSLTPAPLLPVGARLLDLGSGAGFPGLPLVILRPDLQLVSVDAVGKKISFQRHLLRTLPLAGVTAIHARAEELARLPGWRGRFDVVVSRAFSALPLFVELARPFLAETGWLLAMKGGGGADELAAAGPALAQLGFAGEVVTSLRLPLSGAERTLIRLQPR